MPAGRPPKYKTPEEMQIIIDKYFWACEIRKLFIDGMEGLYTPEELEQATAITKDIHPTISGLAYTLGMSRQALCDYEVKEKFLDTVKTAKQRVEMYLEQKLFGHNVTGPIFNLKNNFGWKDKTEVDNTHQGKVDHAVSISFEPVCNKSE